MLSIFSNHLKWKQLIATVRGSGHIKANKPNQDFAFVGFVGNFLLVMVCDGLGSHANSAFGAQTLCKLFPKCFKEWSKNRPNQLDDFLRLLQCRWLMHIRRYGVDKCGCTCQLAIINKKGKGILLQIGDGMTIINHKGETTSYTEEKVGFGNETMAMNEGNLLPYWRRHNIDISQQGDRLLIMTDGISEDIIPNAEEKFISAFDLFFKESRRKGQRKLVEELIHWPTPHHTDDKTIVAIERR